MQRTFKIRLYTGFAVAVTLCAASGLTSYVILQKQQHQRVWVRKARSVLDTTASIQDILVDMETGRRGYRATNEKQFLEPYYAGLTRLHPTLEKLKDLLADDPEVENIYALMERHVQDLLKFWQMGRTDASTFSKEYITQRTEDEKKRMDDIRGLIAELQKDETKLFNTRREEYDQLIRYGTLATSIGSILSVGIILILIYMILREFKSRRKIQDQLSNSVAQLKSQTEVLQKSETELKNTTDELGIINKQLEKFVYTVAHDIKSPLSGIVGALGIIRSEEEIEANPRLMQFVDLSSAAAVHLTDMVNFLLEYSRITLAQQAPEMVNMKDLLEHLSVLLFPPKNIRIYVAEQMPVFNTRKLKITQVFQNLISNAIKYNDKEKGEIEIGYADRGDYYEFFVKDNGQGIPRDAHEKVFALTRTTDNKTAADSNTGFGLNIVKLIVEEQGGTIWFDSVEGMGTTFYFTWHK